MRVDVLTLFPAAFQGPLDVSILGRARRAGLLDLQLHDIREHATDRHRSVDDYPFGGGQGMVMRVDVLDAALDHVRELAPGPGLVVYLSPQGERLSDRLVRELAREPRLILVAGRYEGVDERFVEHCVDRVISIGDYVLTGGELPAMVLIDAVARHLPGALGDEASPAEESFADGLLEHPQYTRPAEYRGWRVPDVLLAGDHAAIAAWRAEQRLLRTAARRPDLLPPESTGPGVVKTAGIRIRTGNVDDDFDAVVALWRAAGPAIRLGEGDTRDGLERKLSRDPDLFLVAFSGRRLLGAVLGGWDGRRGYVYHLAVDARHRGRGIGSALLAELERRFRLKGARRLNLLATQADPGLVAFYERRGWRPTGASVLAKDLPAEE
jgi:tRNA (guanine37-N1)-methyltransferase